MLETFTLKQHLEAARQELSQALYQHDAACRVIARLIKERDEARAIINNLQANGMMNVSNHTSNGSDQQMEVDESNDVDSLEGPLTGSVLADISNKCTELSQLRKQRTKQPVDPSLTSKEQIASFATVNSYTPHKSDKPAVNCIANHPTLSNTIATGGADKTIIISDCQSGQVLSRLSAHTKGVTSVAFGTDGSNFLLSSSQDKQVKVWKEASEDSSSYSEALTLSHHQGEISEVSCHPTGLPTTSVVCIFSTATLWCGGMDYDSHISFFRRIIRILMMCLGFYGLSVGKDHMWSLFDIRRGAVLRKVEGFEEYSCGRFHPDGLIMSTGSNRGIIRIWDIREQKNVAALNELTGVPEPDLASGEGAGSDTTIHSICFNENGYHLCTASSLGNVRLWDLRKLKAAQTLEGVSDTRTVAFDYSGQYLAAGNASSVRVLAVKEWTSLLVCTAHLIFF